MNVEVVHAYAGQENESDETLIRRSVETVPRHLGVAIPTEVAVMLTDNANIQEINRRTRQIDAPTDVLSFPLLELDPAELAGWVPEGTDTDPETGAVMLGDIVISLDAVNSQATAYGHSRDRELAYLSVHGMLHLFGYDHMEENDKARMRAAEDTVMDELGLTRQEGENGR